ncbi:MAG: M48 family metalloprotease [Deltaproteobacteria bacterium]|nr:M48 family metalloprotease [Deltaproteobacteria bacterium]
MKSGPRFFFYLPRGAMLFAQIIAFILVMAVFEAYQPGPPQLSALESYLASAALAALLWLVVHLSVRMFQSRLSGPRPPADPAKAGRRLVTKLHLAAIACLIAIITLAELKAHLLSWPGMADWESLRGVAALGLYLLLLAVVWSAAHRVERMASLEGLGRRDYLGGQLRLVAPVIFPWFAVSLVQDLISHAWPAAGAWLNTGPGNLVYLLVFVACLALFFPVLVKYWWGCSPLGPGRVRQVSEMVLEHTGVSVGGILSWPLMGGRLLTAGILGLLPRLRYLLITPALAESLDNRELAAVVAHEAGHVTHRHLWFYLMFFAGLFLAAYALAEPMALMMSGLVWWLAGSSWGLDILGSDGAGGALSILPALPLVALLIVYLRLVMGFFMRHFERQADFFALRVMGEAEPLAASLEKIAMMSGNTRDVPSWHHFSIAQRVRALQAAQADPRRIAAQAGLIRRGLMVFFLGLCLVIAGGFAVQGLGLDKQIKQATLERILISELQRRPHDPRLSMQMGILLFERGDEHRALTLLQGAAALAPRDPEVLNSLAWFWATARDESLRRPRQAVNLAQKAVALAPMPHIWDTLAEAYYAAGDPGKAVAAARAALAAKPSERLGYYQAQLERFLAANQQERP